MTLFKRLLFVAFFLEVGVLLVVIPWSAFWDRNYFLQMLPSQGALLRSAFVRGAMSGLGIVNCYVGLAELAAIVAGRRHHPDRGTSSSSTAADQGIA